MRIRNQLLLLVLSILLPAMLASGLAVAYVYKEGRASQHRSMSEAARAFAFNVGAELEARIAMLRTLAKSPSVLRGDLQAFYPYAKRIAPTPETTLILMEENGRQLMNTRMPLGAALPLEHASNLAELMLQYGADRPLISDIFMSPITNRYEFTVQVPVQSDQGKRRYLAMGFNASLMQPLVAKQNSPSSWLTTIIDRRGAVIARSRDHEQHLGKLIRAKSLQVLKSHTRGTYDSVSFDGIPIKAYFHRVPNSDWVVLISIPRAELAELPTRTAAFLGGILLIVLAMAVLAAHWVARRAYRSVEKLGRAAEQLRLGQEVTYMPQGSQEVDSVGQQLDEASRQIRHATQELESRVADAVAKSEQAQRALQRGQKLEALGRLTGGIAHEFNNLLQTLTTALQVAKLTSTQERVQTMLDTCMKAVNRATALTSQLSAFGRTQESRLTTIDLNEQIKGFEKLFVGILPSNISLDLRLHSLWPVTVDPVQLELALLNIAINARDAMPDGGTLTLETQNHTLDQSIDNLPPGAYVRICVTDTGIGMAPDVLTKALDPFFTTKDVGKGTGLGLPQAYGFARQSNGTLVVHSIKGKGTTVEILLPRAHAPVVSPAETPSETLDAMTAGGTVLFVEDDPLVREAVVSALDQAGFTVHMATHAEEALSLLESEVQVDAVFSDIMMPGRLNGIDLARTLRERYPGIRVILATGYTDQQVKQDDIMLIAKPYQTQDVVRLLQQAINSAPGINR